MSSSPLTLVHSDLKESTSLLPELISIVLDYVKLVKCNSCTEYIKQGCPFCWSRDLIHINLMTGFDSSGCNQNGIEYWICSNQKQCKLSQLFLHNQNSYNAKHYNSSSIWNNYSYSTTIKRNGIVIEEKPESDCLILCARKWSYDYDSDEIIDLFTNYPQDI
jgi:hypothetical protein